MRVVIIDLFILFFLVYGFDVGEIKKLSQFEIVFKNF
ncbi:hypothetical protein M2372_004797 [Chryseobacterium sp. BIGb0232]|nr:hypothetical protein [Chryseobacterium sp. BIGb0232]ROS07510.1 hypothetical protein EDF65_4897 [Chryseobacterium nakagawai]